MRCPRSPSKTGRRCSEDLRIVVTNFNSTNGVADVNGDFKVDIIDLAFGANAAVGAGLQPIDFGRTHQSASIRTEHFYNRAGIAIRQVDGRGIATAYVVNELNQVVQITRGAAHSLLPPDPAEPQPLTDFQYLERFFYDFNDNLVLRQLEDRGNTSNVDGNPSSPDLPSNIPDPDPVGGPAFVDTVYMYDILDNWLELLREVANGTSPEFLRTRYRYDPNENLVMVIQPEGNAASFVYDERDLLFQITRGATAPPPLALLGTVDPTDYDVRGGLNSPTSYRYDLNGNLIEIVDAADTDGSIANNSDLISTGDRTRTIYDGFDRRTSIVDSVGNQTVYQYDPDSNLVRVARFGRWVGPAPPPTDPTFCPCPSRRAELSRRPTWSTLTCSA